ncbi:MAG: sensor histidine kinase [Mycobacteriaceae bacterium]
MENMSTPLLDAVTRPRRTWRRLGAGAKLAVYTRLSMQLALLGFGVAMMIMPLLDLNPGSDTSLAPWGKAMIMAAGAALMVITVLVFEFRPEFNIRVRRAARGLLVLGVVVGGVVWGAGMLMYLLGGGSVALTGIFLVIVTLMFVPIGILPWIPWRWTVTLVLALVTTVVLWEELQWWPMFFATMWLSTTRGAAWTVNIAKELDRARITESALQVSEERLRFAQELHDTLGQRLAAMSVKAELARALAKRGDDRVDTELAELQELTRTSMTEMREVIEGYRTVTLTNELQGARQLLESTGVRFELEGDPVDLPAPLQEVAAWLVREGTTNVARHSSASWLTLRFSPNTVTMTNDGVLRDIEKLSGLAGIRRRAEPIGATLVAERDGNLFRVTLELSQEDR